MMMFIIIKKGALAHFLIKGIESRQDGGECFYLLVALVAATSNWSHIISLEKNA